MAKYDGNPPASRQSEPPEAPRGSELPPCELCQRYEPKVPSESSLKAMRELDEGKGKSFATVEEFMADLNADDE
jgi:hypothetical protein